MALEISSISNSVHELLQMRPQPTEPQHTALLRLLRFPKKLSFQKGSPHSAVVANRRSMIFGPRKLQKQTQCSCIHQKIDRSSAQCTAVAQKFLEASSVPFLNGNPCICLFDSLQTLPTKTGLGRHNPSTSNYCLGVLTRKSPPRLLSRC